MPEISKTQESANNLDVQSLTTIRGLAAIWVVLVHYPLMQTLPELGDIFLPICAAGRFAVPFFFILSGYVLGLRYLPKFRTPVPGAIVQFWLLRLGRIYPVHFAMLAIFAVLFARNGWPIQKGLNFHSFVANLFLVQAWNYDFYLSWNYPAWSISSEWFAYLTFPIIAISVARASKAMIYAMTIAFFILASVLYAFEEHLIFKGIVVVIPTFYGGVGLSMLCPPGCSETIKKIRAEVFLASVVLVSYLVKPGPIQSALFLLLSFAIVATLGAAGADSGRIWKNRILAYLGEISYSLYMTHVLVLNLWARFLFDDNYLDMHLLVRGTAFLVLFSTILIVAAGMHVMVESPMRRLSRRIIRQRGNTMDSAARCDSFPPL